MKLSRNNLRMPRQSPLVMMVFSAFFLFVASAHATIYSPGQTLSPDCAPTDANCGIEPGLTIDGSVSGATSQAQEFINGLNVGGNITLGASSTVLDATNGVLFINTATNEPVTFGTGLVTIANLSASTINAQRIGGVMEVDQFSGADFGAKLAACVASLNSTYGGTCDARNMGGAQTMSSTLTIAVPNAVIDLPCGTITTSQQVIIPAGVRNVSFHGCSYQGGSATSGLQGGTVWAYTGNSDAFLIGDASYATDTKGFEFDNININTASAGTSAMGIAFYRTQQITLQQLYLIGNNSLSSTGIFLDGTGNYTGGTFTDVVISGFGTGWYLTGHQSGSVSGDFSNASTFVNTHVDCPESGGNPISGTYGINVQEGDGNTWTGGDAEGCDTMFHLGPDAINNTIDGLRNEVSNYQYVADSGSEYNSVTSGGTLYTGKLVDNGSRNSFQDSFHDTVNGIKGNWYASQQDATVTNHTRLGTGAGNERGLMDEIQTDYGYRWDTGYTDGVTGEQFYTVNDLINNVPRLNIGQYLSATANVVTNVVINNGGCYSSATPPTISFSGGGGSNASGTAVMVSSSCSGGYTISSITMTNGGTGYTSQPTVTFSGANQIQAPNAVAEIVTAGSTNDQTVLNAAGTGAVVINGSTNSGTGGLVIGSGGPSEATVATISNSGNAQFTGTLLVDGATTLGGSTEIRNQADSEIDMILWAGSSTAQKESYIYKNVSGTSQWYMVNDTSNNWALNSAIGGLDSFKAYQSTNSGDTYIDSSNSSGTIRLNYETGSGAGTKIYAGSSAALIASFVATNTIQFPGLAASTGHYCMQIDNSGYISNTGVPCPSANGTNGQVPYFTSSSTIVSAASLLNNGTVVGVNATSATVNFLVKGTGANNPFQINSSSTTPFLSVLSGGNVGIGTSSPSYLLDVDGSATSSYITRIMNTANTSTADGLLISAGSNSATGTVLIGFYRPDNTAIGSIYQSTVGGITYGATSDERVKENFASSTLSIGDLMDVDVESFNFIDDPSKNRTTGFIAQNLENIFPDAVITNGDNGLVPLGSSTPWMVDYGRVTPLIVKGVQDFYDMVFATSSSDTLSTTTLANLMENSSLSLQGKIGFIASSTAAMQNNIVALQTELAAAQSSGSGGVTLQTLNQLTISGALSVEGHVVFGDDTVGEATVLANTTSVTVTFNTPYTERPIITLTPEGDATQLYYRVNNITPQSFNIVVDPVQTVDTVFAWHAFAQAGNAFTITDQNATPTTTVATTSDDMANSDATSTPDTSILTSTSTDQSESSTSSVATTSDEIIASDTVSTGDSDALIGASTSATILDVNNSSTEP